MSRSEKVWFYANWNIDTDKTTGRFGKSDGSFWEKQRVVLEKVTGRFGKSDGSFLEKQRVVLREVTARFLERNGGGMNDTEKCKLKNGEIEL